MGLIPLAKLKQFFRDFSPKICSDITKTETTYNIDNSKNITIVLGNDPKGREHVEEILRAEVRKGATLIDESSQKLIAEFREEEQESDTVDILDFFRDKISSRDLQIIRGALFIRSCGRKREAISELKFDLVQKYGERGRNIANLCGEGYIERYFMPFYEVLVSERDTVEEANEEFLMFFNQVVNELPFTVFVCNKMKSDEAQDRIIRKIENLTSYGYRYVNIHGIGNRNIEVIDETTEKVLSGRKNLRKTVTKSLNRISVRLSITPTSVEG